VAGTAVGANKKVAYRYFIGRYDYNNNFVRGGVSGREVYNNTGGSDDNVIVKGFIPTTIDNSYIVQVYRSDEFASVGGVIDDELQLCYEMPIETNMFSTAIKTITSVDTAGDTLTCAAHGYKNGTIVQIAATTTLPAPFVALTDYFVVGSTTNTFQLATTFLGTAVNITTTGSGTITTRGVNAFCFNDITPNSLLGSTIYTAPSQQGLINNNAPPPLCSDIANFKNFLFFADTETIHRFSFTLISVYNAGSGVLNVNDTITIGSEVYTAKATANVANKEFAIDTASASLSTRIDSTIRSFISVVNQASSSYYAFLATISDDDLPGKCRIEARTLGAAAFGVTSSNQTAFNPQLTGTVTTNQTSKSDAFRNGIMFSKQSEGEAVPIKNQLKVGNSDDPISRIVTIRDSLLIFKAKDGTYILRGDNETNFSVQLLDATAKLVSPESIAILNSQVYGLFEAGICSVSDTSVEVVSDAIKDKIQTLYGQALTNIKAMSFGVGYETEGNYILSVPESSAVDAYPTKQYIYNVFNRNFWEWDLAAKCGLVSSSDGKLYMASSSNNRVLREFKSYTQEDHVDYEASLTLTSQSTTTLTISGTSAMSVGDILTQSGLEPAYVVSVNSAINTCVVDINQPWNIGLPVLHYKAISCAMQWNPDFAGNPAGLKHYQTLNMLFNSALIKTGTLTFSGDTNPGVNQITITGPTSSGGWGYMPWDDGIWGGENAPLPIRVGVPRLNARANNLTVKFEHRIAASDWKLSGVALDFLPTSTRTAR
jgi:hypothetical protein